MPAIDPKKKAADIEKGMKHAREALALLANELGGTKGAPGKEIAAILIGFQKMEAAFLSASAVNGSDFPLLAGAVNTFLDDTFVAVGRLKTVMPGERFDLALGADEAIAVKRRIVNRFTEDTGLTSRGRRITYEILVTLTNNRKTAEKILLREGVPVSRDEKIVVKLLTPAERDIGSAEGQKDITREPEGRLAWRLELKPGEKREIPLKLSIEHPADLVVTGID